MLVDTCVWHAIFDPQDRPRDRPGVSAMNQKIGYMKAVTPWPITYVARFDVRDFHDVCRQRKIEMLP
ncbi:MAG: hypothetical protein ORN28_02675 [Rhodoferax sp.]|nr:hypothetical protein [Rhodoferax sp.]